MNTMKLVELLKSIGKEHLDEANTGKRYKRKLSSSGRYSMRDKDLAEENPVVTVNPEKPELAPAVLGTKPN